AEVFKVFGRSNAVDLFDKLFRAYALADRFGKRFFEILDLLAAIKKSRDVRSGVCVDLERIVDRIQDTAVGHADLKVALVRAERAQHAVRDRDNLRVGLDAGGADQVYI